MGETTGIQWTNASWNPWSGCHRISQGCKNCYMFADKKRFGQDPNQVVRSKTTFNAPLKWAEPKLIFTCSWSDWFIEEADEWRDEAWDIIRRTPHIYQILTKRPDRIREHLPKDWGNGWPNVWLGVSVENQDAADNRIPALLEIPAHIRFLSCEPLLGPIDLENLTDRLFSDDSPVQPLMGSTRIVRALHGEVIHGRVGYESEKIDWVILGGESGPNARPMRREWLDSIIHQCRIAEVPVFIKQLGACFSDERNGIAGKSLKVDRDASGLISRRLLDPKGGEMDEWPEALRIRELPEVALCQQ